MQGREFLMPVCANHPKRETLVTCGQCGKPLCPDCVRHGPVGVRCAECLRLPRSATSAPKLGQIASATAAGLGGALAGGIVLGLWETTGRLGWLLSAITGFGLGSLVWLAAHRSRAATVQLIASLCALLMVGLGLCISLLHGSHGWHGFTAADFATQAGQVRPESLVISAAAAVLGALYRFWR